jgi:hypothetical protein
MKILIVELESHERIVGQLFSLFSGLGETEVYTTKKIAQYVKNVPINKIIDAPTFKGLRYFYLLWKSKSYDVVFFSTGPESLSKYWHLLQNLGFCFLTYFLGSKTILNIRNIDSYWGEEKSNRLLKIGLNRFVRRLALVAVSSITFEYEATRCYAKEKAHNFPFKSSLIANLFSDRYLNRVLPFHQWDSEKLTIGLLGRIEEERKDYNFLVRVLKSLGKDRREQIRIVILGACVDKTGGKITEKLSELISLEMRPGYLDEDQYDCWGAACDILLAPLHDNIGYGKNKGTAAFGEAIYFGKKVIIPKFSCPTGDFDNISLYYHCQTDLEDIFKRMLSSERLKLLEIEKADLEYYSTNKVLQRVVTDLKLPVSSK